MATQPLTIVWRVTSTDPRDVFLNYRDPLTEVDEAESVPAPEPTADGPPAKKIRYSKDFGEWVDRFHSDLAEDKKHPMYMKGVRLVKKYQDTGLPEEDFADGSIESWAIAEFKRTDKQDGAPSMPNDEATGLAIVPLPGGAPNTPQSDAHSMPQGGFPFMQQGGFPFMQQGGFPSFMQQGGAPFMMPQGGAPFMMPQSGAPGGAIVPFSPQVPFMPQAGAPSMMSQGGAPSMMPQGGAPSGAIVPFCPQAGAPFMPQGGAPYGAMVPFYPKAGAPPMPQGGAQAMPQGGAPGTGTFQPTRPSEMPFAAMQQLAAARKADNAQKKAVRMDQQIMAKATAKHAAKCEAAKRKREEQATIKEKHDIVTDYLQQEEEAKGYQDGQ